MGVMLASVFWTFSTQLYSYLGAKYGVRRFNFLKSISSLCFFAVSTFFIGSFYQSMETVSLLMLSGILGFAIGDLFIFYAFAQMGAARTMMVAAFSPFLIATQSYVILGTKLSLRELLGIALLTLCLFFLSREHRMRQGVSLKLVFIALFGVAIDALGVVISKTAFEQDPSLDAMSANFYRILISVVFLAALNLNRRIPLSPKGIQRKDLLLVVLSAFTGTFLSLYLYLDAIAKESPAVMAAIGGLAPVYAAAYEHIRDRQSPSRFFLGAMLLMLLSLYLLLPFFGG